MVSNVSLKFNPIALILIMLGIIAVAFPLASTMTVGVLTGVVFFLLPYSYFYQHHKPLLIIRLLVYAL